MKASDNASIKPRKDNKPPNIIYTDTEILQALEKTGGRTRDACRLLGCSPATMYERANACPKIKEAKKIYRTITADDIHNSLVQIAKTGVIETLVLDENGQIKKDKNGLPRTRFEYVDNKVRVDAMLKLLSYYKQEIQENNEIVTQSRNINIQKWIEEQDATIVTDDTDSANL